MQIVDAIGRNYNTGFWEFLCKSEQFSEVPEGAVVPDYTPEMTVHYDQGATETAAKDENWLEAFMLRGPFGLVERWFN